MREGSGGMAGTPRTKEGLGSRGKETHSAFYFWWQQDLVQAPNSNSQPLTGAPIIRRIHFEFYCQPSGAEGLLKAAISGLMGENNGPFCRCKILRGEREKGKNRIRDVPRCCKTTHHLQGYLTSPPPTIHAHCAVDDRGNAFAW